jgi:hypothetical protein
MCHVASLSKYQLSASTLLTFEAPLHALGNHQHSSLRRIYHLCPLLAAAFEATPQVSDRVVLTCCKEISVLRDQFFFSWSLLEFIFVEFDFLLSFTCAKNTVILADASLPAGNSIAQSFLMSIFLFFCSYECYPKQS